MGEPTRNVAELSSLCKKLVNTYLSMTEAQISKISVVDHKIEERNVCITFHYFPMDSKLRDDV